MCSKYVSLHHQRLGAMSHKHFSPDTDPPKPEIAFL